MMPLSEHETWRMQSRRKKMFSKPFVPQKGKDKKPSQKEGTSKEKLDEATCNEFRRKNIFFNFKDPWEPRHKCMGKGKTHYIEVLSDSLILLGRTQVVHKNVNVL
jgi:hypothetical protein